MMPSGDKEGKMAFVLTSDGEEMIARVAQTIRGAQVPAETFESFKAELSTLRGYCFGSPEIKQSGTNYY